MKLAIIGIVTAMIFGGGVYYAVCVNHQMTTEEVTANKVAAMFYDDGSHKALIKKIKDNLHNPNSFEHVETQRELAENRVGVKMKFRNTNELGGIVTNNAQAVYDNDGKEIYFNLSPIMNSGLTLR